MRSDACTEAVAALGSAALSLLRLCQSERAAVANAQLAEAISSLATELSSAASPSPSASPALLSPASYQQWLDLLVYLQHLHHRLHLLTAEELAAAVAMLRGREAELMELWSRWEQDVAAAMRREAQGERKQEKEEEEDEKEAPGVLRECRLYRLEGEDEEEKEADVNDQAAQRLAAVHARFVQQLKLLQARRDGEPAC